ncbi:MAG: hypothetical protein IH987_13020 [Planctomycetes bacterium]|nr:hypothetical protein [Planctomycetota bacterium]
MFTVNRNPTPSDLRGFGWAMLIGFGGIGALTWLLPWIRGIDGAAAGWSGSRGQIASLCFWALGASMGLVGLTSPVAAKPVYVIWMSLTVPIGLVMSTILLTVLFILLLPVFSIIVRFGDPLRKQRHARNSYWEDPKPYESTMERMARPF